MVHQCMRPWLLGKVQCFILVWKTVLENKWIHFGFVSSRFYPRWKEYEATQAQLLEFSLEEEQWEEDWAGLLSLASQPGSSLEQLHVFALAHILRRPIIVYGVKYVKSFRGEALGYARFEGNWLINATKMVCLFIAECKVSRS